MTMPAIGVSTGGNTVGNTGTKFGTIVLHGGSNITLSQITGGSGQHTIRIDGAAGGGGATLSGYAPYDEGVQVAGQQGQGTMHIQPLQVPDFQHDRIGMSIIFTASSNSSGSATLSMWVGMYTRTGSTLSISQSTSISAAVTFAGTGGDFSLYGGPRMLTIPWTTTWPAGNYWLGIVSRTTSGGTNATFSQLLVSDLNSNFSGVFGVASNATNQRRIGLGTYSATTNAIPDSIAISEIRGTHSNAQRQPNVVWHSGTA